jgi:hypothetical protein
MLGLGAVPSIIMFLGFWFLLPESPRWLAKKGRDEDARKVLTWLRGEDDESSGSSAVEDEMSQVTNKPLTKKEVCKQ